jgi:hypothetical protein
MKLFNEFRLLGTTSVIIALTVATAFAEPPDWLLGIAKMEAPKFPAEVPAVVLRNETLVTVNNDGDFTIRHRFALRILNQSGRKYAVGAVGYVEKEDHVTSSLAWIVRGEKEVRPKEKIEWLDLSAANEGEVFSEQRNLLVNCGDFAVAGDVFGFETRVESKLMFPQLRHDWGVLLPVLADSYGVQLPQGWTLRPLMDGPMASVVRTATGSQRWTWELLDTPYRPDEPDMTESGRNDAHLMITLVPPAALPNDLLPIFRSWADVTSWLLPMQETQCDTSPTLAETARQLTAGANDALSRIRALSRYVQALRYLSYDKGLTKGFGYRPRKASEVYAKGWGDCKAKANLLRAMLRTQGIESYMVEAHASLGREINDAWPSPYQFNHAIVAIKVDASIDFPAVVRTSNLGRLLFFDATDPDVFLGDLPSHLQGGKVHVVAPGSDALIALPVLPVETHYVNNRQVRLELEANGAVTGECNYGGPGAVGAYYRSSSRRHTTKDFRTHIAERLNGTVSGALIADLVTTDDPLTGECRIKYHFTAPRFAQMMPGGLTVVRLDVLSRDAVPAFPAKERKLPIKLDLLLLHDEVSLKLPRGFVVDELPDSAKFTSPYGHYESSYAVVEGAVVSHRTLQLEDRVVPVSEYAALRKFFGDVAKADHSSVVLRKGE